MRYFTLESCYFLKKYPTFLQFLLSFLFISKPLRLNNLKTRKAMNVKISLFVIYVEAIIYCYYIICMAVPLKKRTIKKTFIRLLDSCTRTRFSYNFQNIGNLLQWIYITSVFDKLSNKCSPEVFPPFMIIGLVSDYFLL